MSFSFHSGFAQDIRAMLEFKTALGHKSGSYGWNLANFDRFCLEKFPDESILTKEIAFAWCEEVNVDNKSRYRMYAIREFGKYLVSIGKEAFIFPSKFLPSFKAELPYIFSDEELINFFKAADEVPNCAKSPLLEYTVPVIFRLQYGCGMRPQEVRLLKRINFDFSNNTIYISESKWCKDRRLAVTDDLMDLCRRYDTIADMIIPGRTFFFQSPTGNAYPHGWLTAQFHRCWKRSENGNGKGPSTPYDFRHNFATQTLMRWVEEGKDLNVYIPYLSTYMGHASFHSTYYYVHLLPERLSRMDFTQADGIIPEVTP
jgi:integrase/recombinase XerD